MGRIVENVGERRLHARVSVSHPRNQRAPVTVRHDRNTPARVHRRQGTLRARVRNEPSTGLDSHSAHRVVTASVTTSRMIVNADYNSEHSGVRNVAKKNLSESGDSPRSRSRTTKPSAPRKTAPRQRVEPAE